MQNKSHIINFLFFWYGLDIWRHPCRHLYCMYESTVGPISYYIVVLVIKRCQPSVLSPSKRMNQGWIHCVIWFVTALGICLFCVGCYCLCCPHLCFICLSLSGPGSVQVPDHHTPVLPLLSAHLAHINSKNCCIKAWSSYTAFTSWLLNSPGNFLLVFYECSMCFCTLVYGLQAFSSWVMYCCPFLPVILSFHNHPLSHSVENRIAVCVQ